MSTKTADERAAGNALMGAAIELREARYHIDNANWPIIETGIAVGALLSAIAAIDVALEVLDLGKLPSEYRHLMHSAEDTPR
jgi:hypothetical protein